MKRRTRAGILATASLVACCSVSAAHATPQSPDIDPSPRADEQQVLSCEADIQGDQLIIQVEPAAGVIEVLVDGKSVAYEQPGSNVVVEDLADTTETLSIQVLDVADQAATCDADPPEPSPAPSSASPEPTPSTSDETTPPTSDESTPPDETSPTPDASTPTPTPTPTPPPSSGSTPSKTPTPSAPTTTPARPDLSQPPVTPAPTQESPAPYDAPSLPQAVPRSQNDTSSYEAGAPDDHASSALSVPRDFRPYSQNPRYLLPQLLGIELHRGSELLMPRPQSTGSQELETLPPVSEDELEAIKAELSSPGRADRVTTDAQLEGAETNERVSGTSSWWVWVGAAVVVATGVVVSWLQSRRKRKH